VAVYLFKKVEFFKNLNKNIDLLLEASDIYLLIFVQCFSSTIPPTPTLPCLQTVPMGFSPPTVVLPPKSQSGYFLASMHHQQVREMLNISLGWCQVNVRVIAVVYFIYIGLVVGIIKILCQIRIGKVNGRVQVGLG
jgi:hypothetical protein